MHSIQILKMMKNSPKRNGKRTIKQGQDIGFTYRWFDNMDRQEKIRGLESIL
jgi:hypothetical protein